MRRSSWSGTGVSSTGEVEVGKVANAPALRNSDCSDPETSLRLAPGRDKVAHANRDAVVARG